jgi:hypothetical protein
MVHIELDGREYLIPTNLVSLEDKGKETPYVPGKISYVNGEYHRTEEIRINDEGKIYKIIVQRVGKPKNQT